MQEPSKDYIREFGADQEKKNLPVKFEPSDEWNFEPTINHKVPSKPLPKLSIPVKKPEAQAGIDASFGLNDEGYENRPVTYFDPKTKQNKPANWVTKTPPNPQIPKPDKQGHTSFPAEGITEIELKEMVSSAVLHMMNAPSSTPLLSELTDHQKKEVEDRIHEARRRPGVMSIALKEDFNTDECSVRVLVDPTNRKNWMQIKEETLYKLPYDFKNALHEFASKIWENSRDFFPNLHFRVLKPIDVWVYTNTPQPTNASYGNARISEAPSREYTIEPGMEILYTHGGSYVRTNPQAQVAYQIGLFEPVGVFEKPQGRFKDLWYKHHVEDGALEILSDRIPPVKFELVFGKTV
jgi:hypothetical protein